MQRINSFIYLLSLVALAKSVLVNVTVDDAQPDPLTGQSITFLPTHGWSQGSTCTSCTAALDASQMNGGTWHDGTYFPDRSSGPLNATFTFNGSAIYVYCALGLATTPTLNAYTNMSFFIDGKQVGSFERVPPNTDGFAYNVPVYANTKLTPGKHTFMLQNGEFGNAGNESLTLFDYLVYSYDNGLATTGSTSSSSSASSGSSSSSTALAPPGTSPASSGVLPSPSGLSSATTVSPPPNTTGLSTPSPSSTASSSSALSVHGLKSFVSVMVGITLMF